MYLLDSTTEAGSPMWTHYQMTFSLSSSRFQVFQDLVKCFCLKTQDCFDEDSILSSCSSHALQKMLDHFSRNPAD